MIESIAPRERATTKVRSVAEAIAAIADGSTVAIVGAGGGMLEPDLLIRAVRERFDQTGHPRDLTIVHSAGMGDSMARGLGPLAVPGLITRVIGGHFGTNPELTALINDDQIEAWNLPLGVMSQLFRDAGGDRPGLLTKVGLGTFVDPRQRGGRLNDITRDDLVSLVEIDGEDFLFYRSIPIDVALLRATTSDTRGNLSFDEEPSYLDSLELATAARRGRSKDGQRVPGLSIAQVKRVVPPGTIRPKDARIPGYLIDAVVEHPTQWQTYASESHSGIAGTTRVAATSTPPMEFGPRKVIARRASLEIRDGDVVNLGYGLPDGISAVLAEEGRTDDVTMTVELGVIGGVTGRGATFGAAVNHDSVIPMPTMIDLYHGGTLDVAFLGFAEVDQAGNVNVAKYGGQITGTGGFIDIATNTPRIVFCGTLTSGGLAVDYEPAFRVRTEGRNRKFVRKVEEINFNGQIACRRGQQVLYVTERAVFELTAHGLALREVAEGVDVETDVLALMDFEPIVADIGVLPRELLAQRSMKAQVAV